MWSAIQRKIGLSLKSKFYGQYTAGRSLMDLKTLFSITADLSDFCIFEERKAEEPGMVLVYCVVSLLNLRQLLSGKMKDCPVMHRLGGKCLVEMYCLLIPIQNGPFHPSTVTLDSFLCEKCK